MSIEPDVRSRAPERTAWTARSRVPERTAWTAERAKRRQIRSLLALQRSCFDGWTMGCTKRRVMGVFGLPAARSLDVWTIQRTTAMMRGLGQGAGVLDDALCVPATSFPRGALAGGHTDTPNRSCP